MKKLLILFCVLCSTQAYAISDKYTFLDIPCLMQYWYSDSSGPEVCETGLLAWSSGTWLDDSTVQDDAATGTHLAIPPISIYLDGGSYGTLATAITLIGDFDVSQKFRLAAGSIADIAILGGESAAEGILLYISSDSKILSVIDSANVKFSSLTIAADIDYTVRLQRVGSNLTATLNGVSQTVSCGTTNVVTRYIGKWGLGYETVGNLWDLVIKDSTGTEVLNNYLASGASSTVTPGMVGPDITWTGLTVPDDWETDDPRFGHSWNLDSYVIADGTGTYAIGSYLPASYTTEGTLYTGSAQQNLDVAGYGGDWDGSAYAALATPLTVDSSSKIIITGKTDAVADTLMFLSEGATNDNNLYINPASTISIKIDGNLYTTTGGIGAFGVEYVLTVTRSGTTTTIDFNGTSEALTTVATSMTLTQISQSSSLQYEGTIYSIEVYNSSGVLVNHWIPQSSNTTTQTTIYDVVGGNHATLTGATTPFFTAAIDESWLAQYGGREVENAFTWSEDITNIVWKGSGKDTNTLYTFASQYNSLYYNHSTSEDSVLYTFSFYARRVSGNYDLVITYSGSETGTNTALTITDTLTKYTGTYLGRSGGGLVQIGVQDRNASGHGQIEITNLQLTQYGGSYVQTTTAAIPLSIIPGTTGTTDALGNTKGFTAPYSDSPEGAFVWNAPLTAEVWAADNDNQLINATTGAVEDFDPYDYVEPDPVTFLMGTDGAVLLEDEQTGDCLNQTLEAIGGE